MADDVITVRGEPRMLIDGELVEASSGGTFENEDPATEETIGTVADATPEDAARAVAAARRAFDETSWSTDHKFRQQCLEQLKAALEEAKEELRTTIVTEGGSPVLLTYSVQLDYPVEWLGHWAELAGSYEYERPLPDVESFGGKHRGSLKAEPVGVVTAVTPFNFPLYLNIAKLGPALASGNTVILKPSPYTPWTATILGRLVAEKTDIPAGVVNVVTSTDNATAEALTRDPRVDMVSFTGSTATGRRIMAAAAETVKKVQLELGGKSANIVLDDADIMTALPLAVGWVCAHSGQGCGIYSRLLLPRSRYDEGLAMMEMGFQNMAAGDPKDPATLHGPLISASQRERVLGYIEKGKQEARLVTGGGRPENLDRGYYVQPTLFADVDPGSTIAREEVFGPVLCVIPYEDDDDAVRIANDSVYGLTGNVWSASEERALGVANRIRAGSVSVNGAQWLDVTRPFGGFKQSGIGRENGTQGFEEFLETKVLALPG
ncbi:MAG: aldehyde dehydrogenase family protein [Actinomycetota bacterium]